MLKQYNNNIIIINVKEVLFKVGTNSIAGLVKTWLLSPSRIHILDFKGVETLTPVHTTILFNYAKKLTSKGKQLNSINVSKSLVEFYEKNQTSLNYLNVKKSLEDAAGNEFRSSIRTQNKINSKVKESYAKICLKNIKLVFEDQLGVNINKSTLFEKRLEASFYQVCAYIKISGGDINGYLLLSFSDQVMVKAHNAMLEDDCTEINDEIKETSKELLNMIFGGVKASFNKTKTVIAMAFPELIAHENFLQQYPDDNYVTLFFESSIGNFLLEVQMRGH